MRVSIACREIHGSDQINLATSCDVVDEGMFSHNLERPEHERSRPFIATFLSLLLIHKLDILDSPFRHILQSKLPRPHKLVVSTFIIVPNFNEQVSVIVIVA
jgi:hypothetical protein